MLWGDGKMGLVTVKYRLWITLLLTTGLYIVGFILPQALHRIGFIRIEKTPMLCKFNQLPTLHTMSVPHNSSQVASSHGHNRHTKTFTADTLNDGDTWKTVLFFTPFFRHKDFYLGFGKKPFAKCSEFGLETRCIATSNRSLLSTSDAVLVHPYTGDLSLRDLPTDSRPHSQRWVLYYAEPPSKYSGDEANFKALGGVFNWTMTYRHDSDIIYQYGHIHKQRGNTLATKQQDHTLGKDRLVAWLVSDCHTHSKREQFVKALQRYITVDVYGRCGNLTCERSARCMQMLQRRYKFFLSFENSFCRDYVTEKLYKALQQHLVVVVMGGGDYARLVPPQSVIDALAFPSARHLADYLKHLDTHTAEYNRYFDWKPHYRVEMWNTIGFCQLCQKLHDRNEPAKTYADIYSWYFRDACSMGAWSEDGQWTGTKHPYRLFNASA